MTGPYGPPNSYGPPGGNPYGGQPQSPYGGGPYGGQPHQPQQPPSPYGQPQQQPAAYGQPGFPQPGYGPPPKQGGGAAKGLIIGAAVLVAATVLGFLGFWFLGRQKVLDAAQAEKDVKAVLTASAPNGYGETNITDVKCPDKGKDIKVKKDQTFTCSLKKDGKETTVRAKFTNNAGDYQVGPADQP